MSGFEVDRFASAEITPRTDSVPVPDLKDWFDGEPVWKVRALTFDELARAEEAADRSATLTKLVESIVSSNASEKVAAIKGALGLTDDVPQNAIRRMEMLVAGSVEPEVDLTVVVKLANVYPVVFKQLTDKIITLTGQGSILGKVPDSGDSPTSEPA